MDIMKKPNKPIYKNFLRISAFTNISYLELLKLYSYIKGFTPLRIIRSTVTKLNIITINNNNIYKMFNLLKTIVIIMRIFF